MNVLIPVSRQSDVNPSVSNAVFPSGVFPLQFLALACLLLIASCTTTPTGSSGATVIPQQASAPQIQELLDLYSSSDGVQAASYLITALELMIDSGRQGQALELLPLVNSALLTNELRARFGIVTAQIHVYSGDVQQAMEVINGPLLSQLFNLSYESQWRAMKTRLDIYSAAGQKSTGLREIIQFNANLSPAQQAETHDVIWESLATMQASELSVLADSADSYELRGWVELARQSRAQQYSLESQIEAINRWRSIWVRHTANRALPGNLIELEQAWEQRPQHVALLLPLQEQIGVALLAKAFLSAYYQALNRRARRTGN